MPSLISGFEYDIFISYRQKDNKGDRWVSEFVEALKAELESTFKDEISIYFDINPHDGLLESHDVDESLKEKLKCLIFIPIISRTYCDPRSFAWEHEFKAFIGQATLDPFGLKIKLPNGNVAGRVLPVRIYDLDAEDIKLCESVLEGALRGIEFIYKESGVNRPLKPDDDEKLNINKTKYRNQINKVANAIKEIFSALKTKPGPFSEVETEQSNLFEEYKEEDKNIKRFDSLHSRPGTRNRFIIWLSVFLCIIFAIAILKVKNNGPDFEKSVAVLPFKLLSDEPDKQYLADGMMDAITLHLSKIKDLRVMSRTSVEQYRGTTKTTRLIGKELEVEYLLEGSFQKFGDNAKLIVQLNRAKEERQVWANEYNSKWNDVFSLQSEIARSVASELKAFITPEENKLIKKVPTANLKAYDLYLKAGNYQSEYAKTRNLDSYQKAVAFYQASLDIDSTFARAYIGLAWLYWDMYYYETYFKENFLDSCLVLANIALSFDDKLDEAYLLKAEYFRQKGQEDTAIVNYDKALKINPNSFLAYSNKGVILIQFKLDFLKGIENYHKALKLISDDKQSLALLRDLGTAYMEIGFTDLARENYHKILEKNKDSGSYYASIAYLEFSNGNYEVALKYGKKANEIRKTFTFSPVYYTVIPNRIEEGYLYAKKSDENYIQTRKFNLDNSHNVGYLCWKAGKYDEADIYFKRQIQYSEENIKLGKPSSQSRKTDQTILASVYAFMGDKEKAYKYLEELDAMNALPLFRINLFKNSPFFTKIRDEERFQKMLQNFVSKSQAEHEKVRKWLAENKIK